MTARPEIVQVLMDIRLNPETGKFTRGDGSPLTAEETDLVGQATRAELDAASALLETMVDLHTTQAQLMRQFSNLVEPYFAKLPEGTLLDEALAIMPAGERAEAERLMDQVAPGGFVIRGGGA